MRFAHALVRDAAYSRLPLSRRVRLHLLAGEALEALYAGDIDPHLAELAHHFFQAGAGPKAFDYARRAGIRAVELLAFEEAARLFEKALQAGATDAREHCELLLLRADAESRAGDAVAAGTTFLRVAEAARAAALPEVLARAAADRVAYPPGWALRVFWSLLMAGHEAIKQDGTPRHQVVDAIMNSLTEGIITSR
jgi:predicted ATPase